MSGVVYLCNAHARQRQAHNSRTETEGATPMWLGVSRATSNQVAPPESRELPQWVSSKCLWRAIDSALPGPDI
jgi:hypothetical protein